MDNMIQNPENPPINCEVQKSKIKLGSHVGMSGKEMFAGSVKEALSYGANTFMIYTGAPQNTRRKELEELNIEAGWKLMKENMIEEFIVHAPYIINPANAANPDIFELAVNFLRLELTRTAAMGSHTLVLHPGSHVGEGREKGIEKIAQCINTVLEDESVCRLPDGTFCNIALETMAGKGSEIGFTLEDLTDIYGKVIKSQFLRVCMDTCHMHDAGYSIATDFESVLLKFDKLLGLSQIAAIHINDSKNPCGARKDRHANIGEGYIGYDALHQIVHHPALLSVPKILETPYRPLPQNPKKSTAPYKEEIAWLLK